MINHFFPFLVSSGPINGGSVNPVVVRSTDGTSEISNHKGRS